MRARKILQGIISGIIFTDPAWKKETTKNMNPPENKPDYGRLFLILYVALAMILIYTFLHEGGHALIVLAFGGALTEFEIAPWDAHISFFGNFTALENSLRAVAGMALPIIVWIVFMLFASRKGSPMMQLIKYYSGCMLFTIIPWVIISILHPLGLAPAGDDATAFLEFSGLNGFITAPIFLALFLAALWFYLRQMGGWAGARSTLVTNVAAVNLTNSRTPAIALSGLLVVIFAVTAILQTRLAPKQVSDFRPPEDYQWISTVMLSDRDYQNETVASFSLEQECETSVYLWVKDVDTTYFDVTLIGPEGKQFPMLHAEGYKSTYDSAKIETNLGPGEYRLVMTGSQSRDLGEVSFYLKLPEDAATVTTQP